VNIFKDPGYVELIEEFEGLHFWSNVFEEGPAGEVLIGDLLRINCVQVGAEFPGKGYEFVLRWA
jgi:hypothetical protein